jgi:hypothetical protein
MKDERIEEKNHWREKTLEVLDVALARTFARGDYREMAELAYLHLSGRIMGPFHPPGSDSNASWMAKVIHVLKLLAFRNQLVEARVFTKPEMKRIHEVGVFILLIYVMHWFECSLGVDAAVNDLALQNSSSMPHSTVPSARMCSRYCHFVPLLRQGPR